MKPHLSSHAWLPVFCSQSCNLKTQIGGFIPLWGIKYNFFLNWGVATPSHDGFHCEPWKWTTLSHPWWILIQDWTHWVVRWCLISIVKKKICFLKEVHYINLWKHDFCHGLVCPWSSFLWRNSSSLPMDGSWRLGSVACLTPIV